MRFYKRVKFQTVIGVGSYDPKTQKRTRGTIDTVVRYCHVHDLGRDESVAVFGTTEVEALTVIHRGFLVNAETVLIDGVEYNIVRSSYTMNRSSYTVRRSSP